MSSYFRDLDKNSEMIRKLLFDHASRIVKCVGWAQNNPSKASANLEKAAQCADKWQEKAKKIKEVTIDKKHYQRMSELSEMLRACVSIEDHKKRSRMAELAIQELRQVIKSSKK
jgi:hypothetical protein